MKLFYLAAFPNAGQNFFSTSVQQDVLTAANAAFNSWFGENTSANMNIINSLPANLIGNNNRE